MPVSVTGPGPTAKAIIDRVATAHGWSIDTTRNTRTNYHRNGTWLTVTYADNATQAVQRAWRTINHSGVTTNLTTRDKDKRETVLEWLMTKKDCNECSETLAVMDADTIAQVLNDEVVRPTATEKG